MQSTQIYNTAAALPLPLDGTDNTRDLGGYPTRGGGQTAMGRFYRSDSLHLLSPTGQRALARANVRYVVDLRTNGEAYRKPDRFGKHFAPLYIRLPLNDKIPQPDGTTKRPESLPQLYTSILENEQPTLRALFNLLARIEDGAVLFHCKLGKDRTGVVSMLLLGLARVEPESILADYAASEHYMASKLQRCKLCDVFSGLPVPEHLYRSRPGDMLPVLEYLNQRYHGAHHYLRHIGCAREDLQRLRARLQQGEAQSRPA